MSVKNKNIVQRTVRGMFSVAHCVLSCAVYQALRIKWALAGAKKPDADAAALMRENVTFIYKSFERQELAKKLYYNIQSYYPGVRVIIADDSSSPLDLTADHLEVIQLPFNSGLSYGLNRALERVETPYVVRMDDDELLTPHTKFHDQLRFLYEHPYVDLVGVLPLSAPGCKSLKKVKRRYAEQSMQIPIRRLKIPHGTRLDDTHIVVGKAPNIFIAKTEQLRAIGYDDKIRMLDHREFFYRAAGKLVSVIDETAYIFHDHNRFRKGYQEYRQDVQGDRQYIAVKLHFMEMQLLRQHMENKAEGNEGE